jgi:hypothetical protein
MAAPKKECPTCGEEGDDFEGPASAGVHHFMHRAIWQLHCLRLSAQACDAPEMVAWVSGQIRDLEKAYSRLFVDGRH